MSIKILSTNKKLSSWGGIYSVSTLYNKLNLSTHLRPALPKLKASYSSERNLAKIRQMILTFVAGADCLDDMEGLAKEPGLEGILGRDETYTSKSCGNFLRSFSNMNCKQLNYELINTGFKLRSQLPLEKQKSITIDLDSTINKQYGKKLEGGGVAYNGVYGLDTIQAFDDFGIQYWNEVRQGGTYSSQGAVTIIHEIFKRMPKTPEFKKMRKYFRGDSAFCNSAIFNSCLTKNAGFVICMKANIFNPLIKNVSHWKSQNPKDSKRIMFYDGRECEIGQTLYSPDLCEQVLRVVFIRAKKEEPQEALIEHQDNYDYYAWVTSIGEHEMSNVKLIKFYRKRGQAENFIRELKYGFDLKHYPCQKLLANRAFGVIAAFAYNLVRFLSVSKNPTKPSYAKRFRNRYLRLPCQVIKHAGQVSFRLMHHHAKEVNRWLEYIQKLQFGFA